MARRFETALSQYLISAAAPNLTSHPFTFAGWSKFLTTTIPSSVLFVESATLGRNHRISINDVTEKVRARAVKSGVPSQDGVAESDAPITANTWYHVAGVFPSTTSRQCYVDGGNVASNSTTVDYFAPAEVRIGSSRVHNEPDLEVAECAIWNVSLTASEISDLATGKVPNLIRPSGLIHYWRLINDDTDEIGGLDLTPINAPTFVDHPFVIDDISGRPSMNVSVNETNDVQIGLNPRAAYLVAHTGFDDAGSQADARIFFSTDGSAVDADFSQAAGKGFLAPTTSSFGIPMRIAGISTLRLKSTVSPATVSITKLVP